MNTLLKRTTSLSLVLGLSMSLAGCAALGVNGSKVKKAPCGPTAGITDPCGNAVPINNGDEVDAVYEEYFRGSETV